MCDIEMPLPKITEATSNGALPQAGYAQGPHVSRAGMGDEISMREFFTPGKDELTDNRRCPQPLG